MICSKILKAVSTAKVVTRPVSLVSCDDAINRLATIRKRQLDGSIKAVVDEDMRQRLMAKRLEAIPHFPIEGE